MTTRFSSLIMLFLLIVPATSMAWFERVDKHKDDIYYWPKTFAKDGDRRLTVHQPQVIDWPDYKTVKIRLVLSYQAGVNDKRLYGTAEISAKTNIDKPSRQVKLTDLKLDKLKILDLSSKSADVLEKEIAALLPEDGMIMSLDRMTANFERRAAASAQTKLKSKPPKIYVRQQAAALVMLDGDKPIWSPIENSALQFAVNTNWDLFFHKDSKAYFLRQGKSWITASELKGPWHIAFKLPDEFYRLPNNPNWQTVIANLPSGKPVVKTAPDIILNYGPAELILLDGEPDLTAIKNTALSYIANTDSELFFSSDDKHYYYLVSGRWFRSKTLNDKSKWTFATDKLPEDFKNIPRNSPKADARALVPGTVEAETAVIMAQIPNKVKVYRTRPRPTVIYIGDPVFHSIEDTELTYAVNTASDVIQYRDKFYLCQDAIWFVANSPTGPWQVASEVPAEIYLIPPSSPLFHVTFVYVYDSDYDTVTVGYTSGYSNVYTSWGIVVYGTGWYYPHYWYYRPVYYRYPIYYPYPRTYGSNTYYNPNTGTYGRAGWAYGPYGGMTRGTTYNPTTGTYTRAAASYSRGESSRWFEAHNPRTSTRVGSVKHRDHYSSWGATAIKRDDNWAVTGHYKGEEGKVRGFKTSEGRSGFVGRDDNNLYAGRDGNIYRRNEDGWQKYDDGDWNSIDKSTARERRNENLRQEPSPSSGRVYGSGERRLQPGQSPNVNRLNRNHYQRQYGQQRFNQQRSWQSGAGQRTYGTGRISPGRR